MALKCQDKGGDSGAGSMCVYLQTGIGSGSSGEWKKTEAHSQMQTTNPKQARLMQVRQMCTCVCMWAGVRRVLIENNIMILSSKVMFFTMPPLSGVNFIDILEPTNHHLTQGA